MHEASIAQNILDVVRDHTSDPTAVDAIHVRIGEFSGVLADSVQFCFQAMTAGTEWSHVRLVIDPIPFVLRCRSCGHTGHNEPGFVFCGHCGSGETDVVSGDDLSVTAIHLKEC